MTDEISIRDEADHERYVASIDGADVGEILYRVAGNTITFVHTEVDTSVEGRGVGSALAVRVLDDAVAAGRTIAPRCPFVAAYIKRHPQYLEHVEASYRDQLQ